MSEAFRDPSLPVAERARDLLERLTPQERIAMLHQAAPAIERLGIAEFRTGAETLHGVAWLGEATVFPQPVGLAATWDVELIERVGEVVGEELLAKKAQNPLVSPNVWAPVVNTLRHPAWGRNEEGYSEDPHLTAHFATAYGRGLRGSHESVWRTVPALKHFLGYSNETDRSATNSEMSLRTLHEEELPAFRGPIEASAAGGIMLAYNRVNGAAAHTQPELVAEARSWAPGSLAVVSDAGAPTFLVTIQREQPDAVHAAAALVRAGMDSFTDNDANAQPTIDAVTGALEAGLLTQAHVDTAVLHLLELRVRSGEFDGEASPYADTTAVHLDLPASRELAREVVAASTVVLRNEEGLLPLAEPQRIAVVGQLAELVLTDWYSGTPPYAVGIAQALRERYPNAHLEVASGADVVTLRDGEGRVLQADADGKLAMVAGGDDTFAVTDWGDGVLTLRSRASDRLLTGGTYPMRADATRVGGWVVQESFRRHDHEDGTISLLHRGSGRWVRVARDIPLVLADGVTIDEATRFTVDVVENGIEAVVRAASTADAVVAVVGNDPHIAGRETADRPHLWLPESASSLVRAARGANPALVLTIVSSYPYVMPDGVADVPTIVWTSHAGQELGHGVVDVLAGDAEPSGRLAQSWPALPEQAGDLFDYDTLRQQATYRHQPEPFAFALGHGLTYSTVVYEGVSLDRDAVPAPAPTHHHPGFIARAQQDVVTARVRVRNAGDRAAHELVQVYSLAPVEAQLAPRRLLVAYERVLLEPGETRDVSLTFAVERLATWDGSLRLEGAPRDWLHEGALRVMPGTYRVAAGPSADELPVSVALEVTAL
ncbi:beta-glucosidase family protein [Demequina sp.]|uniref:beta-glucosidase family protein n=1 Tax=Demequina sp. TaxID=2050685 RepID=UPI003D10560F